MSIVLNELTWVEEVLRRRELTGKPFETFTRIAKYYTYQGLSRKEIRQKLDEFLLSCDPKTSIVKWDKTLDRAVKDGMKYPLVIIDSIGITKGELEKIDAMESVMLRRLAFTLLCVAKYGHIVNPDSAYWVQTARSDIMRMANITTSVKRQCALYSELNTLGLVQFAKKIDNLNVKVLFVDDSPVVLEVTDFRNLGYQYMMYRGGRYAVCANCGIVYKRSGERGKGGRPSKYCSDCAAKIALKQRVESSMRCRNKAKKNLPV